MLPAGGNPEYYAEDLLGTSRVVMQNNGAVCYDADFYPYGGERAYTNNCPSANVYKFEGKERDTETGNDDFGARYYSNRFGRWLSADWSNVPAPVPYANLTNPQTLNLYSMVADDPESFADLDGHCTLLAGAGPQTCAINNNTPPLQGEGTTEGSNRTGTGESSTAQTPDQAQVTAQQNANQAQGQSGAQRWEAQQQVTPEKMANALKQAGQMGDAGVKAGLVVVAAEATVAAGVVAAPTAVPALSSAGSQVLAAANSAYVQAGTALSAAGTAIGNAYRAGVELAQRAVVTIDTIKSGGGAFNAAGQVVQAATSNRTPPAPNKFGAVGLAIKIAIKLLSQ